MLIRNHLTHTANVRMTGGAASRIVQISWTHLLVACLAVASALVFRVQVEQEQRGVKSLMASCRGLRNAQQR
ncbi:hypothetical protein EDB92DRAFT_373788 [Lactarius akahatsu]|uniref:Uncharacterized protein n=1 Tax=Lactarius akahatsu TaxID=416441 RepID=A0AAD4LHR1_9AGAM|nr:hypothetical protein EDB92DRAFT_373788 [Lactarius akahatsu]